jgi:dipeptidyl aminopeptidase/acylaminoacyl peptidase
LNTVPDPSSNLRPVVVAAAVFAALALAPRPPAAAAPSSPEFRYIDEDDDAVAAKLLEPLLKKYAGPTKCADLVKLLRKRTYPGNAKDRDTLEWDCPDGKKRQFTYILPKKYAPGKPSPLLVFLHGAVRQPAPGGGAGEAAQIAMPAVAELDAIVVGPSTYDGVEWGAPSCRALVRHALAHVKRSFNVDENRIWIAGDSDGGRGTFRILETEAGTFAAAVPVIGSPGGVTRFANLRNVPVFAINGEADSIFKIDHVREMVDGMKASGIDLAWKLVPKGAHDPFFIVKFKDEVQTFLKAHVRDPFPKKVEWVLDPSVTDPVETAIAGTFRWIRVDAAGATTSSTSFEDASTGLLRGDFPRIEATRNGNRIDVRTSGVARYTVLVAPEMIDPKKDLEVRTNGKLSWRGKAEPDARTILEEARRTLDRTSIFTTRIAVEVDGPAVPESPSPAPAPEPGAPGAK